MEQAEGGTPVSGLCREHGMSSASFYKWRTKFGRMDASLITKMKDMAEQNRRLKRMYAEMSMQNDLPKEAALRPSIAPSHTYCVCAAGNGQAIAKQSAERVADESLSVNVPFTCRSVNGHEYSHAAGHKYRACLPHLPN